MRWSVHVCIGSHIEIECLGTFISALLNRPLLFILCISSIQSGMTSSETPLYKTNYYECLQNVIARLYDTSHELCGITLAARRASTVACIL